MNKKKVHPIEQEKVLEEESDFFTTAALAQRWLIRPCTLCRWRWEGKGPTFTKMGHKVVYSQVDVLNFEEKQRRRSTAKSCLIKEEDLKP